MVFRRWLPSRLAWSFVFLLVVAGMGSSARHAGAQELSGTIRYTGSKGGQVSDSRPIGIDLISQLGAKTEVDRAYIATNGAAFTLHAPAAGQYYLVYFLDVINIRDGSVFPGEPFQFYNHRFTLPLDTISVPQAGVNLEFDDTGIISGIGGIVTYTGSLSGRGIIVQAFTDPQLNTVPAFTYIYAHNGGYYAITTLDSNVYYLRALLDVNGDGVFEPGEPFAICASPIRAGPDQTGVNITFGDGGASTCIVPSLSTPTPTQAPSLTPTPTVTASPSAVTLSGTILYTGTHGPVSSTRRILVFLTDTPSLSSDTTLFLKAKVSTNPGTFNFDVPAAGNYYLLYSLDEHNTGSLNVGTPFTAYNSRCGFPADPIAAPQSNVQVQFGDTCFPSGIAGNMTYKGSLGSVSAGQRLCLQAFADADLLTNGWLGPPCGANEENNGEGYDLPTFDARTYYLRAFLDLNGNRALDAGEPFQIYSNKSRAPGDPVAASTTQTDINFTFGDENVVPSACVGDCSNDRSVTVDELLTMVNIALGNADISACDAGDANHDGQITIDEILTAVNNALNGCS
jgi:hypothetical protein